MFTRQTLLMVYLITIGLSLLATGCDSQSNKKRKTPLISINTSKAEEPHIEGQAFMKTTDGIDQLAGIEVHVYPPSMMQQYQTMKEASTTAKETIPQTKAQLQDIQKKIRNYHEKKDQYHQKQKNANQWRQVLSTLEYNTKDFIENRHEKFTYYHPFYKKQVTVTWSKNTISWKNWHENVQRELLTLVQKTKIRVNQAAQQEQSSYETVSAIPIDEFIDLESQTTQDLKTHQQNQLKAFQIVDVIMHKQKPLKKMYADDEGHFDCNIEPGNYLVLATWTTGTTYYTWLESVQVEEKQEGQVILSTTNAHSIEQDIKNKKKN